jgi:hypothetical protein
VTEGSAGAGLAVSGTGDRFLDTRVLRNRGQAIWSGGRILMTGAARIENLGTFRAEVDNSVVWNGGSGQTFDNQGTFIKASSAGTTTIGSSVTFNNSGTVDLQSGILSISGSYSPAGTSSLNIAIGGTAVGTEYARLAVGGSAALAGSLNLSLVNGFSPATPDTFTIVTYASRTGAFDPITGLEIGDGRSFGVEYNSSNVRLVVNEPPPTATPTVTPTPTATAVPTATPTPSATPVECESYASLVMSRGPALYYRLGEASGSAAADEAETQDGIYNDTGSLSYGEAGAIASDADTAIRSADGYLVVPDVAALDPGSGDGGSVMTWEGWYKTSALDGGTKPLWNRWSESNGKQMLTFLNQGAGGRAQCLVHVGGQDHLAESATGGLGDGEWHHVVCRHDGTANGDGLSIFVDGVLEGHNSAASGTLSAVTGPAELFGFSNGDVSGRPTASEPFWADEVAYYQHALSDQEIAAHYNAGVNGCAPTPTPVPTPTDTPANP